MSRSLPLLLLLVAACGTPDPAADPPPLQPRPLDPLPAPPGRPASGQGRAVLTYHNDNLRTGAYLHEELLSPQALAQHGLQLVFTRPVDQGVIAQILYVPGLVVGGVGRDVFFAATLGNSVYAYDANDDSNPGTEAGLLWRTELTDPVRPSRQYARGILSTPVIDLDANELFVVFSTKDQLEEPIGESDLDIAFYLAVLDLTTGAVKRQVEITATVPRADGSPLDFLPRNHRNRPGLLLSQGSIWVAFGTRRKEELVDYHGWVMRYDAQTLAPQGVFCTTRNRRGASIDSSGEGGGIWQGSAGLVADEAGAVYLLSGNATVSEANESYGNAFLKLVPEGDQIRLAAWFTPYDPQGLLQINDVDLGSGGPAILPGTSHILGGGKTGILYLLDTAALTERQEFQAFLNVYNPTFQVDSNWEGGPHLHGGPVVWQGPDPDTIHLYHWAENDYLRAYQYSRKAGRIDQLSGKAGPMLAIEGIMPGGMIALSANGSQPGSGVVWASLPRSSEPDPTFGAYPGWLLAFDAETLELLCQEEIPTIPKWMPPTVADGKVFIPTVSNQLLVYTLGK
jgi:hypothetical protein